MTSFLSHFFQLPFMMFSTQVEPASQAHQYATRDRANSLQPPASAWTPLCHSLEEETTKQVDGYFLEHWPFPNDKARKTFVNAGFSRVTCFYFPLSKDDRIHWACRLLTILFLIDDVLEDLSFADGEEYNNKLIPIMRGHVKPNRSIPVEYMMWDLWEGMRAHDKALADDVLEPTFTFMRSQTDRQRLTITKLGEYLEYRERDVGKALLSALMRFSMALNIPTDELKGMVALERNCSKQISVVNDIYSYEKELKQSQTGHSEGSVLCTAVKVLSEEAALDVPATKRVLWQMTRELELVHDEMTEEKIAKGCSQAAKDYMKGLEYQMSGNEQWSRTTLRYNKLD